MRTASTGLDTESKNLLFVLINHAHVLQLIALPTSEGILY